MSSILQSSRYDMRLDDLVEIDLKGLSSPTFSRPDSFGPSESRLSFASSIGNSPSLATDASSFRSSLSSVSSPALNSSYNFGHKPSALMANMSSSSINDSFEEKHKQASVPVPSTHANKELKFYRDNSHPSAAASQPNLQHNRMAASTQNLTSTATLSQYPSFKYKHHKQRERDYDASADNDDDDLPNDFMMFNVPMTPALCAKEKQSRKEKPSKSNSENSKTAKPRLKMQPPSQTPPVGRHEQRLSRGHISPRSSLPSIDEHQVHSQPSAGNKSLSKGSPTTPQGMHSPFVGFKPREIENWEDDARRISEAIAKRPHSVSSTESVISNYVPKAASEVSLVSPIPSPNNSGTFHAGSSSPAGLTRPSFLPQKSSNEERAHMKEFARLMERAAEHEHIKKDEEAKRDLDRQSQAQIDLNLWTVWLDSPNKQFVAREVIEKKIWWRGIPEKVRSRVWLRQAKIAPAGGAELPKVSASLFDPAVLADIGRHAESVWPQLGIFGRERPLHEALVNVISNFLIRSPKISFDQSLVHIAALFLLNADEYDSFNLMMFVYKGSLPGALLLGDDRCKSAYYEVYQKVFRTKFPRLSDHFDQIAIFPKLYLDSMLQSIFCTNLTPEAAARIMDVYLYEGDNFLLRAALGVVRIHEYALYQDQRQVLKQLKEVVTLDEHQLMHTIRDITRD